MAEFHKEHYKDTAKQLVEENSSLVDYMKQSEKDSMEVVAYLRKIDSEKDEEVIVNNIRKCLNKHLTFFEHPR